MTSEGAQGEGEGHRGVHGEAVTTLAQRSEPVWCQQGGNYPLLGGNSEQLFWVGSGFA